MNMRLQSMLSLLILAFASSAEGLVVPHVGKAGAHQAKYAALKACARRKEGDSCTLQPSPFAMVLIEGSCQLDQVDVEGVTAAALSCKPKTIPVKTASSSNVKASADSKPIFPETAGEKAGLPVLEPGIQIPAQSVSGSVSGSTQE